ncbi:hypothetical protein SFC76_01775 [Sphingomonas sp. CD22]|uniref:EF-hand domain-containing protein n=1 Tax=Sphingomonas sp. CD22 TaxID=3100214 RepID=UPI002ADFD00C|nr:hypothetical protein [Sphingomonas sp. CD22]MEA1082974.1 hypothetical protein [Sphingomonas sp. CD22]
MTSMRFGLAIASGLLATAAVAQTVPPAPPPGGGMMRLDANHDGVITRPEMIAEAEARFAAMDADKDGKVTPAERDAARPQWRGAGNRPRGGGDREMTRAETLARAGQRFDRLDTNHDGKLDAAELAAARPMRGPRGGGDTPPPAPPAQ